MYKKRQHGFSIIEIVLVIGILAVITVISSNLLTRTYRINSDAELTSKLKQNGAQASDMISEAIRMADSIVCGGDGLIYDRMVIQTSSGKYWRFRFVVQSPSGNGYIAKQENLDPEGLTDPSDLLGFCIQIPNPSQEIIITDKNPGSGVSITDGRFEKIPGSGGKDTVTIKFDVGPAINQVGVKGVVNIQTTVQVR